jgi:polysaccharide export outer membrane protein
MKPGLLCFLAALLASGCANSSDFTVPMPDLSLAGPANAPADVAGAETSAYGEPAIVPAAFSGGPQAVADADGPYLLDTGDRLRVFVYGQPKLSHGYTIHHEGAITVPLIGTVKAFNRAVHSSFTARSRRPVNTPTCRA